LLANNSLSPQSSANYEYKQGVPDLGLPLDNGYAKYPNMFSLYGNQYPRDGNQVGDHGQNWQDTGVYRFFRQRVGASKAAVFFYNQTISQSQAYVIEQLAKAEGFQIVYESGGHSGENFSGPSWDTDVQTMKGTGADIIFDTVDVNANQKICSALDRYQVTPQIKAKVTTVEGWSQDVGTSAWSTGCRNLIYGWDRSDAYSDTGNPAIKQFVDAFNTYEKPQGYTMAQWSVDGWLAGQMLVDYLNQAGAAPTRTGFMEWLNSIKPYTYDAHGLVSNSDTWWQPAAHPENRSRCWAIAQWQDSAATFVNRGGSPFYCATTSEVGAAFTPDGS
jgi:branched-chain amino acid transport system substrate-binding protein